MKTKLLLFVLFSLLGTILAQGQGFPIVGTVSVTPSQRAQTRDEIFRRESDQLDLSYTSVGSGTVATGVVGRTSTFTPMDLALIDYVPYGFQAKVNGFVISADGPCRVTGYIRKGGWSATLPKAAAKVNISFGASGGQVVIPTPDLTLHSGSKLIFTKIETSSGPVPQVDLYTSANIISENRNYTASKIYLSIGNSISWGTLGPNALGQPNTGITHFNARTNTTLRQEGIDIRPALRGFGGSVAQNWVQAIDMGLLENQDFDLVSILLGTNEAALSDASSVDGATGMTFAQMIEYICDYLYRRNPDACVLLLAPPPATTTPRITNLPSYRTALSGVKSLAKYSGKDLLYIDLSANIPVPTGANDANYTETTANAQVHPRGDTGHLKMYQSIMPVLRTSQFYDKYKNLAKPLAP